MGLAAGVVVVDLVSKVAASTWLDDGPVRLGAAVTLRLVHNPGVAFGVGARLPSWAVLGITGVAVSGLAWAAFRQALSPAPAAGLVVGGAFANLVDRASSGRGRHLRPRVVADVQSGRHLHHRRRCRDAGGGSTAVAEAQELELRHGDER